MSDLPAMTRAQRAISGLRLLLATFWAGSLWTVGYVAAPTFFATLPDRLLAGTVAGNLFRVEAWLSMACGVLLLVLFGIARDLQHRRLLLWLAAAMLACTLVGYFGIQPYMAALKAAAGPDGVMEGATRARFGLLHGVASLIYLVQSLLAVGLVLRQR
jgi:hypothetical protein